MPCRWRTLHPPCKSDPSEQQQHDQPRWQGGTVEQPQWPCHPQPVGAPLANAHRAWALVGGHHPGESLTWRKEELSSDTCVFSFQVVLSLQLGTGAFTAFASSCLPRHNTVASFVCRVSVKKPFSAGPRLSGDQPVSPCLAPPFPPSHPCTLASLIISVLTRDTSLLGEKHCFPPFLSPQT